MSGRLSGVAGSDRPPVPGEGACDEAAEDPEGNGGAGGGGAAETRCLWLQPASRRGAAQRAARRIPARLFTAGSGTRGFKAAGQLPQLSTNAVEQADAFAANLGDIPVVGVIDR